MSTTESKIYKPENKNVLLILMILPTESQLSKPKLILLLKKKSALKEKSRLSVIKPQL
jgi:hypothetical protein